MANGFTVTAFIPSEAPPRPQGATLGPAPAGRASVLGPEPIIPLEAVGTAPPPTPATPTGSADDLLRRIAAGEDVEITPQVLAQIALGPQRPAPAPTPIPGASGYSITAFVPA